MPLHTVLNIISEGEKLARPALVAQLKDYVKIVKLITNIQKSVTT